jgi:hypothetical protein
MQIGRVHRNQNLHIYIYYNLHLTHIQIYLYCFLLVGSVFLLRMAMGVILRFIYGTAPLAAYKDSHFIYPFY